MAELQEGFLDKLKTAIKTSTAGAKARAAGDWFREKARQAGASARMRAVTPNQLLRRQPEDSIMLGKMFFYEYDPKFAKKLPYYDTFPLVLPLENYPDGFLGINFHYLGVTLRIKLLDRLVDFSNNTAFDESTRLIVDYSKLKNINLIKPTLHRYLSGQMKTQIRRIDADEFTIATLLPVQRFKKESAGRVWADSRKMI